MHKIEQSLGSLGKPLGPLLKTGLPIMENVLKLLAKNVLIPSRLTAAASAAEAAIHKKCLERCYNINNLKWRNEYYKKKVKSMEKSGLLTTRVSERVKNEAKGQKGGFLQMLLRNLGASLLGNLLTGKGTIRARRDSNK